MTEEATNEGRVQLYQYAVLLKPTEAERKKGKRPTIVVPITSLVASSTQEAFGLAYRAIPKAHEANMDRVEVAVRPF